MFDIAQYTRENLAVAAWIICGILIYFYARFLGRKLEKDGYNYYCFIRTVIAAALGPIGLICCILVTIIRWEELFPNFNDKLGAKPPKWM